MAEFKKSKFGARDSSRSSGGFSRDRPSGRFDSGDSGRGRRFGGDSDRPSGRFDSSRPSRNEQFDVVCDKCGKNCTVPFKPTNSKPVYCSDCFRKNESFEPRAAPRSNQSSGDLEEINAKLDKIMRALKIE